MRGAHAAQKIITVERCISNKIRTFARSQGRMAVEMTYFNFILWHLNISVMFTRFEKNPSGHWEASHI